MRGTPHRGMAMGVVLMVIAAAFIAAFTMAAISTTNLNFAQHYAGARDAQYLAESAIARAVYNVADNSAWGTGGTEQIIVQPDVNDNRRMATINFNPSLPLPLSTNNIAGTTSVGWQNAIVPAGCVRLLVTATSRGATSTIDALVTAPQFPYVVGSDGAFQCNGALIVKGANSMHDAVTQIQNNTPPQPASLGCNNSVSTTAASQISGDLVAAGTVSLASGSSVGGVIRYGTVTMPHIDPTIWDPTGKPGAVQVDATSAFNSVSHLDYTSGDLNVPSGVTMAGGLLYVKGNLTINGGLDGYGVVISTGSTTIVGGADLAAANLVALVSVGNININGAVSTPKYFQGLVYTQGILTATNITLVGTLIAGGASLSGNGQGGGMTLTNAVVYHAPEASTIDMIVPASKDPGWMSGQSGDPMGGPDYYTPVANPSPGPVPLPSVAPGPSPGSTPLPAPSPFYPAIVASNYMDTSNNTLRPYSGAPFGLPVFPGAYSGQGNLGQVTAGNGAHPTLYVDVSGLWFDPSSGLYHQGSAADLQVIKSPSMAYYTVSPPQYAPGTLVGAYDPTSALTGGNVQSLSTLGEAQQVLTSHGINASVNDMVNFALNVQSQFATLANQAILSSLPPASQTMNINLTLNRFLGNVAPYRIISWKVR